MANQNTGFSIKCWAEDDRPREKLLLKGRKTLSNAELIAILIRAGNKEESAVDISRQILKTVDGNLGELGKLSVSDLRKFKGVGEAKAISIVAALELGRRRNNAEHKIKPKVTSSRHVFDLLFPHLADLAHEEFWILLLSRSNKVIEICNISKGGVSGTIADSKVIFKQAVEKLASAIILCHNHPSGNLQPSSSDVKLTKKLKNAGELLEIPILDHLIIGEKSYYSFADEGIL